MGSAYLYDQPASVNLYDDPSSIAVYDQPATVNLPQDDGTVVILSYAGPAGPQGTAAGQDIGWGPLTGGFLAGEVLDFPPLTRPATFVVAYWHSRTGCASPQSLVIQQLRGGSVFASATISLPAGSLNGSETITPLAFLAGDVPSLVMPNPADAQLFDLTLSLGSQ